MKRLIIGAAATVLLLSSAAQAEKTLYVKTKDAKVLEKADLKAKVKATLKYGQEVTWEGADKAPFHKIKTNDVSGVMVQQNLTPNAPAMEVSKSDGKPIDQAAFKSSGAATKALSEAGLKYAEGDTDIATATRGLITAESIAAKIDLQQAADYVAKSTGGGK